MTRKKTVNMRRWSDESRHRKFNSVRRTYLKSNVLLDYFVSHSSKWSSHKIRKKVFQSTSFRYESRTNTDTLSFNCYVLVSTLTYPWFTNDIFLLNDYYFKYSYSYFNIYE